MRRYIIIVYVALLSLGTYAYTPLAPEVSHFISLHGDLGYSAMLHNIADQKPSTGMNTNIGVDYRLYHNHFLFSAGLEGMYQMNINLMDKLDVTIPMLDTERDLFDMHVHVDKSRDMTHMVNVNVPLLFGGEWKRFYFLLGPKISLNVYGMTSSSAQFTTYGEYDRYYDDFYEMPNHQFMSDREMKSGSLPISWNMNIMAHAEIGGRIGHMYKAKQFRIRPDKVRMYLAAYVDFGLLNIQRNHGGSPIFEFRETDKGVQFFIQPLMLSNLSDNAMVRNLNVGIKYTIAFELPKKGKSYIYDYNKVDRDFIKRGGNQMIK